MDVPGDGRYRGEGYVGGAARQGRGGTDGALEEVKGIIGNKYSTNVESPPPPQLRDVLIVQCLGSPNGPLPVEDGISRYPSLALLSFHSAPLIRRPVLVTLEPVVPPSNARVYQH